MSRAPLPSDYAVLGLRPGATAAELRAAYRRLAKELHPDRNPGDASARERFLQLTVSYAALRGSGRSGSGSMPRATRHSAIAEGDTIVQLALGDALWVEPEAVMVAPGRRARLHPEGSGARFPGVDHTVRVHRRADGYHVFIPPQPSIRWPLAPAAEDTSLPIAVLWIGDRQEDGGSLSPRMPRRLLAGTVAEMVVPSTGWAAADALRVDAAGRWLLDGAEPLCSDPHPATPLRILRDGAGHWVYADQPATNWSPAEQVDEAALLPVAGGLLDGVPIGGLSAASAT